ncbi:MAG: alpha/beta hydrolase, partial [Coprobacillus sp.]
FEATTNEAFITSEDNLKLEAKYKKQENSHLWTIAIHGYKSDNSNMMSYASRYYEKGYNVLMPNNRAHGSSEGSYIGMGWLDKDDIAKWVDWIVKQDSEAQIILHGVSMGGATVMMTSGDNLDHVVGYIEDCGYTSVWDIFASELDKRFSLPTFPILDISNLIASLQAGYDFKDAS